MALEDEDWEGVHEDVCDGVYICVPLRDWVTLVVRLCDCEAPELMDCVAVGTWLAVAVDDTLVVCDGVLVEDNEVLGERDCVNVTVGLRDCEGVAA